MMKDGMLAGALVLIIAVVGLILYAGTRPTPARVPVASQIKEETQYLSINAAWPSTTPLAASAGSTADAAAVALMRGEVERAVEQFKADTRVASLTPEDIQTIGLGQDGRKYTLDISYTATSSPATLSYIYAIYYDTLGAHPNGTYLTESFAAASGAHLALGDLFAPGTDYLAELSSASRAALPAIIAEREGVSVSEVDPQMLQAGTASAAESFQWFYLTPGYLNLLFPPYAVGPYALGSVTLPLPTSSLSGLKAEYR